MTAVTSDPRVGDTLAAYRLDGLLGRGGMGVVYRAEHLTLHRQVALKLIAPELAADPVFRERFLRESRLAASLDHPNVIPIYDAGEVDDRLFLAMRIVEGRSLRELLAEQGRFSPARALDLLVPVAAALDAAHTRGLVHRDVKPANILIEGDGAEAHVYLSDFGLAQLEGEPGTAEAVHLSGSLHYVAPEQVTDHAGNPAVDVYALGCVLFECLTGETPYRDGSPMALLWAHAAEPPPAARERRPGLPPAIDTVLRRALAKEPGDRYRTCGELCAAASDALGLRYLVKAREWESSGRDRRFLLRGQELRNAEASVGQVVDRTEPELSALQRAYVGAGRGAATRRQRLALAISLGVAALAVALLVFALISRSNATSEARRADAATFTSQSRRLAVESEAQLTVDPERSILLAMAVQASPTDEAISALRRALDRSRLRVRLAGVGHQGLLQGPAIAFSPDGTRLVEGSQSGVATVFDTTTGHVLQRIHSGTWAATVGWSPNGRLAIARGCAISLHDPRTYERLFKKKDVCSVPSNYAFSPDGSVLYYAGARGVIRWDLRANRLRVLTRPSELARHGIGPPHQLSLSTDGKRLAVASFPGVALLDATTGRLLAAGEREHMAAWLAFSPDGTQIAAAESPMEFFNAGDIVLLDPHSLTRRTTLAHLDAQAFTALAFSPDGTQLAYGASDGTAAILSAKSGRELASLPGNTTLVFQVAFSPDGSYLATSAMDGRTLIWDAAPAEQLTIRTGGFGENLGGDSLDMSDLSFPRSIVTRSATTTGPLAGRVLVRAWSHDGRPVAPPLVLAPADENAIVRLSPDGRFALTISAGPYLHLQASQEEPPVVPAQIWDVEARRIVRTLDLIVPAGTAPRFSPDGMQIATTVLLPNPDELGASAELDLVDSTSGERRSLGRTRCGRSGTGYWVAVSFSRDGAMLGATDNCGELAAWNTTTGRPVGRRVSFGDLASLGPLAFSPDGRQIAVANSDNVGQATILDIATGRAVAHLTDHTRMIQDIAYSPDGSMIATASLDGSARIWDARSGRPLRIFDVPDGGSSIAFSPDRQSVAVLDFAGTIHVWDACTACGDAAELMAIAREQVTRQLTPAERRTFRVGESN